MSEGNKKDVQFVLGELSGKMDGLINSVSTFSIALTAHTASDEKNFKEIRDEVASVKVSMARYAGGAVVLSAALGVAGWVVPLLIK